VKNGQVQSLLAAGCDRLNIFYREKKRYGGMRGGAFFFLQRIFWTVSLNLFEKFRFIISSTLLALFTA